MQFEIEVLRNVCALFYWECALLIPFEAIINGNKSKYLHLKKEDNFFLNIFLSESNIIRASYLHKFFWWKGPSPPCQQHSGGSIPERRFISRTFSYSYTVKVIMLWKVLITCFHLLITYKPFKVTKTKGNQLIFVQRRRRGGLPCWEEQSSARQFPPMRMTSIKR
jgi:hypothetical protein